MPDDDEFSDYPRLTTATKKKILGLNAAKLYDIEVPAEFQLASARRRRTPPPRAGRRRSWSTGSMTSATDTRRASLAQRSGRARLGQRRARRAGDGARPGARRADHHARVRRLVHRLPGRGRAGPAAAAHLLLRAQLRLPDGGRRLRRGVGHPRGAPGRDRARRPLRLGRDQRRGGRAGGLRAVVRRRGGRRAGRAARRLPPQGGHGRHRPGLPAAARRRGRPGQPAGADPGRVRPPPRCSGCRERRAELGLPAGDDALAADRPGDRGAACARIRRAAAPAAGPADPDQHRSERQHLPRHAAAPTTTTRPGLGSCKPQAEEDQ